MDGLPEDKPAPSKAAVRPPLRSVLTLLPKKLRQELFTIARKHSREYRELFIENRNARNAAGRFYVALLAPGGKRGRPQHKETTTAYELYETIRLENPHWKA